MSLRLQATAAGKGDVQTSCKAAIDAWREKNNNEDPTLAKKVSLICQLPSIKKMEPTLNVLTACEHLSLSSNAIDRLIPLTGLKALKVLSLGRNQLKKIEKLEDNAATLEELWLSYNSIDKLEGLTGMKKLRVLYLSNNQIKTFDELLKLVHAHTAHTTAQHSTATVFGRVRMLTRVRCAVLVCSATCPRWRTSSSSATRATTASPRSSEESRSAQLTHTAHAQQPCSHEHAPVLPVLTPSTRGCVVCVSGAASSAQDQEARRCRRGRHREGSSNGLSSSGRRIIRTP